jgi:hypothetical protein
VLCGDESAAAAWDLCFVWDQDKSTNLWPRSSIVNDKKPLFLKELSRVWEAVPCFSAVNTVLVDNHEEKFERNPLGTCVRVPEWAPGSEDGLLDPVHYTTLRYSVCLSVCLTVVIAGQRAVDAP